jgi:hypothetical protein
MGKKTKEWNIDNHRSRSGTRLCLICKHTVGDHTVYYGQRTKAKECFVPDCACEQILLRQK